MTTATRIAADRIARTNCATAGGWEVFAGHRARLTALIRALCGEGVGRLAILGAGNCNDVDLARLLGCASRIELVDLDGEALGRGVARQRVGRAGAIELRGGVDVTGAAHRLGRPVPGDAALDRYEEHLARAQPLARVPAADVVVSACLLSSLIATVVDALGAGHPRLLRLVTLVRDQHLRVLAALLAAGGRGLLVSDLVSSDTCPALRNAPDHALQAIADRALAERNFFTGTHPRVVAERLGELPVSDVHLLRPWRWRIGPTRAYLVYAVTFRRA